MIDPVLAKADEKMKVTIDVFKRDLSGVRTGRATPALVENVRIDYNGVSTPLNHVSNISASGTNLLIIQPWDSGIVSTIEKAILKANLGITPLSDGSLIRLTIPPLSEERRTEMIKLAKKMAEEHKVAVRNVRRDALEELKKLEKNKSISQDDLRRGEAKLQKITDSAVATIDSLESAKATELKQV